MDLIYIVALPGLIALHIVLLLRASKADKVNASASRGYATNTNTLEGISWLFLVPAFVTMLVAMINYVAYTGNFAEKLWPISIGLMLGHLLVGFLTLKEDKPQP